MTQQTQNPETKAAAAAQAEASTSPDALVAQIRAIRAMVPEYAQISREERRRMITVAKITSPEFVQASISGVSTSPSLQQNLGRTPEEMRADTMDALTGAAAENEARALLEGIVTANLVRRHRIGKTALRAYALSQRMVDQPEHADLIPHLEAMKLTNRFGIGKRKKAEPAPATVPAQTAE